MHVQRHPVNGGTDPARLQFGDELGAINLQPVQLKPDDVQVPGMDPVRLDAWGSA